MKQTNQIDELIVQLLKNNKDAFVSGQTLSNRIGITRAAVWKHIEGLRGEGYIIVSTPSRGYKLIEIPDRLSAVGIKQGIKTRVIGKEIVVCDEVNSTNDIAMEKGAQGEKEGLVVIADSQLLGKGRLGRTWISPKGVNLYLSVLLRPEFPPLQAPALTMMASVAVAAAISKTTGLDARIKWPNDILIDQKKVSGILTEMNAEEERIHYVVIGVGINVNMKKEDFPEGLRMPATSLMESLGRRVDRTELLYTLLESMDSNYEGLKTKGIMPMVQEWRRLCSTLHKRVRVSLPGEVITGVAEDITQEGGLVVRIGEELTRKVYAGDVTLLE